MNDIKTLHSSLCDLKQAWIDFIQVSFIDPVLKPCLDGLCNVLHSITARGWQR